MLLLKTSNGVIRHTIVINDDTLVLFVRQWLSFCTFSRRLKSAFIEWLIISTVDGGLVFGESLAQYINQQLVRQLIQIHVKVFQLIQICGLRVRGIGSVGMVTETTVDVIVSEVNPLQSAGSPHLFVVLSHNAIHLKSRFGQFWVLENAIQLIQVHHSISNDVFTATTPTGGCD